MRFSIDMCRGNILDIINLAEAKNLLIDSIEQGPINDDMINIKVKISKESNIHDIESFVKSIREFSSLNSCELV